VRDVATRRTARALALCVRGVSLSPCQPLGGGTCTFVVHACDVAESKGSGDGAELLTEGGLGECAAEGVLRGASQSIRGTLLGDSGTVC